MGAVAAGAMAAFSMAMPTAFASRGVVAAVAVAVAEAMAAFSMAMPAPTHLPSSSSHGSSSHGSSSHGSSSSRLQLAVMAAAGAVGAVAVAKSGGVGRVASL